MRELRHKARETSKLEPWQDRHVTERDLPLPSLALPFGEHISDRKELLDEMKSRDIEMLQDKLANALAKAVAALYFADNSDYESALLWDVIKSISQEAVDLLENDCGAAFDKYCEGR
jgi:hypothetical protein